MKSLRQKLSRWLRDRSSEQAPPEEHSFVLDGESYLAIVHVTVHDHSSWMAMRNGPSGPTERERKFASWNPVVREVLPNRLPIEEALTWLHSNRYEQSSRGGGVRLAYLTIVHRVDRSDQEVVVFSRARHVESENPVNTLINAIDDSFLNMLLS